MATIGQHIAAFFDPTVAVNKEGYLVEADGLFDSGDTSTDYLVESELSGVRDFIYGSSGNEGTDFADGFANSDSAGAYDQDVIDQVLKGARYAAEQQQNAAQSSADRAMEFSKDQADLAYERNSYEAQLNRDFQAAQTQKAMDYNTLMSNTYYQRAMADLKDAGLNPKLIAKFGSPSTPSGFAASGSSASASAASGVAANMTAASIAPVAQVLSTYITGADALDRNQNDFVQHILSALIFAASHGKS